MAIKLCTMSCITTRSRHVEADEIQDLAERVLADLNDLTVLLMFSVFEADVRQQTLDAMAREVVEPPRHLVLRQAFDDARDRVSHGSFGHLTNSYKTLDTNQKSLVDQVRAYRNWVAHGRREVPINHITPAAAYDRLQGFLALLGPHLEPMGDGIGNPE